MKKRLLSILLIIVMTAGIFPALPDGVVTAHALYTPNNKIQAADTSFHLLDDNKEYKVSDLKGKVAVLIYGSVGCPASKMVVNMCNSFTSLVTSEVEIIFIAKENEELVRKSKYPETYTNIKMGVDTYKYSSMATHIGKLQKMGTIPMPVFLIIDRDGYYYRFSTAGNNTNATSIREALEAMDDSSLFIENEFTVTFLDYDESVLETVTVKRGQAAKPSVVPSREGYVFNGWNKEINKISSNMTVKAMYSKADEETIKISDGTLTINQVINMAKKYPHSGFNFSKVTSYETEPSLKAPYKAGSLEEKEINDALNALKMVRFLAGVPYEDVKFTSELNEIAQHGAVLLAASDQYSHTPAKPDDMDDNFFKIGYAGCSEANLTKSPNISRSVLSFVYDFGEDNLAKAGHRRWVLNPNTKNFGIGFAKNGDVRRANLHVFDGGIGEPENYVAWPNAGYFPLQYFYADNTLTNTLNIPWSINLGKAYQAPDKSTLMITLRRTRDNKIWTFDKYTKDLGGLSLISHDGMHLAVDNDLIGMQKAITFRPDLQTLGPIKPGDIFEVRISGIKKANGEPATIGYRIKFFDLKQAMYESSGEQSSTQFAEEANAYSISTDPSEKLVLDTVVENRYNRIPYKITVTNTGSKPTGTLNVSLSGSGVSGFSLSKSSMASIPVGKSSSFTVAPNLLLKAGKYGATITISGKNIIDKEITVSLTVAKPTTTTTNKTTDTTSKTSTDKATNETTGNTPGKATDTTAKTPVIKIKRQPTVSTTVTQGNISGILAVDASVTEGKKLNYQWAVSKTGKNPPLGTKIPGATGKTFTIPTDLKPGTYYYFCVITADGAEEKRTNIAKVVVKEKTALRIGANILSYPSKTTYVLGEGFDTEGLNVVNYISGKTRNINDKLTFHTSNSVEIKQGQPFTTAGRKVVAIRYNGQNVGTYTIYVDENPAEEADAGE